MGLIAVVAPAAIAVWFPRDRQGMPMGLWATWVPVGSLLMYILGPAMVAAGGWQAVWWFGAIFASVAFVLYGLFMREPPQSGEAHLSASQPSLREALSNRNIWLLGLAFGCFNAIFLGFATFFPTYLAEVQGYSLSQAAFVASIATMVVLFSAPLAGVLSDRIGSRRLVFSIPFLVIAVMFLLPFHASGWQLYVYMMLLGPGHRGHTDSHLRCCSRDYGKAGTGRDRAWCDHDVPESRHGRRADPLWRGGSIFRLGRCRLRHDPAGSRRFYPGLASQGALITKTGQYTIFLKPG